MKEHSAHVFNLDLKVASVGDVMSACVINLFVFSHRRRSQRLQVCRDMEHSTWTISTPWRTAAVEVSSPVSLSSPVLFSSPSTAFTVLISLHMSAVDVSWCTVKGALVIDSC